MSGWKKSSSSPRTQVEPQSHNFKGGIDFKFSKIHVAFCCSPSRKRVVELKFFLQNYKLFTQPAGKADLTETQARKVRDGDVRLFSPCISQFFPLSKTYFFLAYSQFCLARQTLQALSIDVLYNSTSHHLCNLDSCSNLLQHKSSWISFLTESKDIHMYQYPFSNQAGFGGLKSSCPISKVKLTSV